MMKNFSAIRLALLVTSLTTTPFAFAAPADIKSAMIERCADEAVQLKMADTASAKKVCACTINVQANQLKLGEFWEIQSTAMKGQNPNNLSALKRIKPDLDKCRAGIKISEPQFPTAPAGKK